MKRTAAVLLLAIRIAAFPLLREELPKLDNQNANKIITGRHGNGAQVEERLTHLNSLDARQFDFDSISGGLFGGQQPKSTGQPRGGGIYPGFSLFGGRGQQGARGSQGGRGQQEQPNGPPGLPANLSPGQGPAPTWLPGGVPAGGPGYQSATNTPAVEPVPTNPMVEAPLPAPVEPLPIVNPESAPSPSPSPFTAPYEPFLPGGVPADGPGYEAQTPANAPPAIPAPTPSSSEVTAAPIEEPPPKLSLPSIPSPVEPPVVQPSYSTSEPFGPWPATTAAGKSLKCQLRSIETNLISST